MSSNETIFKPDEPDLVGNVVELRHQWHKRCFI